MAAVAVNSAPVPRHRPAARLRCEEGSSPTQGTNGGSGMDHHASTVLLVEDDPGIKEVIGDSLAARGYRVLHADDGLDAFSLICSARSRIDVIVSELDGDETSWTRA